MDSPLNIIVVEDHDDLREITVAALGYLGHKVRGAHCAEALDDELGSFRADVLVLDLNLPGEDGLSLARRMRSAMPRIGIIMVTVREQIPDKTQGYDSGADLYLTKPTSMEELGAAIRALSRRLLPNRSMEAMIRLNPLRLQLHGPEAVVNVSNQEALLLIALGKAVHQRLETWQMLEILEVNPGGISKNALEVQITRLRKKLGQVGAKDPTIKAIRGTGYQLCVPVVLIEGL